MGMPPDVEKHVNNVMPRYAKVDQGNTPLLLMMKSLPIEVEEEIVSFLPFVFILRTESLAGSLVVQGSRNYESRGRHLCKHSKVRGVSCTGFWERDITTASLRDLRRTATHQQGQYLQL